MTLALLALLACKGPSASPVTDVRVEVDSDVATLLHVSWNQEEDADIVRVEYAFEGRDWASTPLETVAAGDHSVTVLGVPAETPVDVRIVGEVDGEPFTADEGWTGTTGPLPEDFPLPTLVTSDPDTLSSSPYLYTTVATGASSYEGPWWAYIIDRDARPVWYRKLPDGREAVMSRVSADGTHLTWVEVSWFGQPSTLERTTLDGAFSGSTELPLVGYTYDELPDGTIAYDAWDLNNSVGIRTVAPDGTLTDVWSCTQWAGADTPWSSCGTNTVNYDEARGTYLWSLYDLGTVVEVDPASGEATGSWGSVGADPFGPADVGLQMQHYPNWSIDGTLLLSSQEPGDERVEWAREFAFDASTGGIEQIWSYSTTEHYADCSGEAVRVENGNTLINYGCGEAIREVTQAGEVAWEVETHEVIGHQTLIDDLYALNRGDDLGTVTP